MSDDVPSELRTLVTRYGTHVLDDPDGLRATLDDFLDEDVNPGDSICWSTPCASARSNG